jgi:hypothetical protein
MEKIRQGPMLHLGVQVWMMMTMMMINRWCASVKRDLAGWLPVMNGKWCAIEAPFRHFRALQKILKKSQPITSISLILNVMQTRYNCVSRLNNLCVIRGLESNKHSRAYGDWRKRHIQELRNKYDIWLIPFSRRKRAVTVRPAATANNRTSLRILAVPLRCRRLPSPARFRVRTHTASRSGTARCL